MAECVAQKNDRMQFGSEFEYCSRLMVGSMRLPGYNIFLNREGQVARSLNT